MILFQTEKKALPLVWSNKVLEVGDDTVLISTFLFIIKSILFLFEKEETNKVLVKRPHIVGGNKNSTNV